MVGIDIAGLGRTVLALGGEIARVSIETVLALGAVLVVLAGRVELEVCLATCAPAKV